MRLIISSTAFSGGHLSVTTRFIALAQTFSLLRMVNFQFLVNSNVTVPAENWSCTTLRCGSSVQNLLEAPDFVTGYQRPSAPSTYGCRFSSCIRKATNSLPRFLFLAFSKIMPTFTAARYCIGLPSGLFGKPALLSGSFQLMAEGGVQPLPTVSV